MITANLISICPAGQPGLYERCQLARRCYRVWQQGSKSMEDVNYIGPDLKGYVAACLVSSVSESSNFVNEQLFAARLNQHRGQVAEVRIYRGRQGVFGVGAAKIQIGILKQATAGQERIRRRCS